jgi:hypothetical protein
VTVIRGGAAGYHLVSERHHQRTADRKIGDGPWHRNTRPNGYQASAKEDERARRAGQVPASHTSFNPPLGVPTTGQRAAPIAADRPWAQATRVDFRRAGSARSYRRVRRQPMAGWCDDSSGSS